MKKLFDVIGLPLLFVVSQFFMTIIATIIFLVNSNHPNLDEWIKTEDYVNSLAQFFSTYNAVFVVISFLILFPYFYKKYHKETIPRKGKISFLNFIFLIILGSSVSLMYSSILSLFHSLNATETSHIWTSMIGTVFLGPILEEYLFRGITYHKLQKYVTRMQSILLTGIVFAFCHTNLTQIMYAFLFNFILIFVYERLGIKASLLVHMSGNMVSLLMGSLLVKNEMIGGILLLFLPILLIGSYIGLRTDSNRYDH